MQDHVHYEEPTVPEPEAHQHQPVQPAPVQPAYQQPVAPPAEPATSWTAYAAIKYGFILVITVIILYFIAKFVIPLFT